MAFILFLLTKTALDKGEIRVLQYQ